MAKLQHTIFVFYAKLDNLNYKFDISILDTKATWLLRIASLFFAPMTIFQTKANSDQLWEICVYCSSHNLVKYLLLRKNLKRQLASHGINKRNLYKFPIVCRELGDNILSSTKFFTSKSCFEYSKYIKVIETLCAMHELSLQINFTLTTYPTIIWDPVITSRTTVNEQNLELERSWLLHYVFLLEYGFMSASINSNITLTNVYIKPLSWSSWLVVPSLISFLSVMLTDLNFFRKYSENFVIRFINIVFVVTKILWINQQVVLTQTVQI